MGNDKRKKKKRSGAISKNTTIDKTVIDSTSSLENTFRGTIPTSLTEVDSVQNFPIERGASNRFLTLSGNERNNVFSIYPEGSLLGNSIFAVNDLSRGLGIGIINRELNDGYTKSIDNQDYLLRHLVPQFPVSSAVDLNFRSPSDYLSSIIAPMSGAIADVGLVNSNMHSLMSSGLIAEPQINFATSISDLCLNTIQDQQIGALHAFPKETLAWENPHLSSMKIVADGVSTIMRSFPDYPIDIKLPSLEIVHEAAEVEAAEKLEYEEKLDLFLSQISPDLVDYRKGCWEAFNRKGKDYIGQASSSMRRLVDTLLHIIAPDDKVKATNYFKTSPRAKSDKGTPTRKARIHYAIKLEKKKASHLERLMDGFLNAYENLPAWDHNPIDKDAFVHGTFVTIEGYLISILSEVEN